MTDKQNNKQNNKIKSKILIIVAIIAILSAAGIIMLISNQAIIQKEKVKMPHVIIKAPLTLNKNNMQQTITITNKAQKHTALTLTPLMIIR